MKTKFTMFRRGAMFYMQDSATGKQTSLRTKDEAEANSLLNARNAAQQQPTLNLHLALTGVCVFGATGSGKTSGPAKHLAYGYLAAGFGGLVLCAKKEERRQWEHWAAECDRTDDLVIVDASGQNRFNFMAWEASRPEAGGGI